MGPRRPGTPANAKMPFVPRTRIASKATCEAPAAS